MSYKFKFKGMEKLRADFRKLPKFVRDEIHNEFKEAASEMQKEMKRRAPKNFRRIAGSITTEKTKGGYKIVVQNDYAAYQEFGTKSKAVIPAGWEDFASQFKGDKGNGKGFENILAWVKAKKISGTYGARSRRRHGNRVTKDQQDRTAALFIWRKIASKGIGPRPFFVPAVERQEKELPNRLKAVLNRALK